MTLSLSIRTVAEGDCDSLTRFLKANNRPEITRSFNPFPLSSETAKTIALGQHQDRYYVAEADGQIVGFAMLRGWDEGFEVPSFGVLVDYQRHGKGIGRQLTEFAIAEAKKLGSPGVRLTVYKSNAPAKHLYESLGFIETESKQVVVAGFPDDKIVMIKELR